MAIVDELIAILGYQVTGAEKLRAFTGSITDAAGKINALARTMGVMGAAAAGTVATGLAFLGNSVISTSAKFETYSATLETIEGSAEKAKTALDWISDFATTTPYEVDELTRGFVKLRSYGLDPMDGSMTVLGDTAAGMQKSLDQVVEAFADATTFQFERLRELGIVASQKGNEATFSWTENGKSMTRTINKTSTEVTKFLNEVWGKKFSGAMIRQSKTWTGMLSNLGDSWTGFQRKIGDAGFFETVKGKLADLMDTVATWQKDGTIEKIATGLSNAFIFAADMVGIGMDRIKHHIKYLMDNLETVGPWLKTFGISMGLLIMNAFPLLSFLVFLGFAVDDFLTYLEGGESVIGDFLGWLRSLIPGSEETKDALMQLGGYVSAGLLAAFVLAPATLGTIVGKIIGALVFRLGPALVVGLTGLSTSIVSGFTAAFALLSNPVGWTIILAGVAAALIAYFWQDLKKLWAAVDFSELGKAIGDGIIRGLQGIGSRITAMITGFQLPSADSWGVGGQPLVPAQPTTPGGQMGALFNPQANLESNVAKIGNSGAAAVQDNRQTTTTTTITAPVNVTVQQASQAPGAVGDAISTTVKSVPSRMQMWGAKP